MGASWWSRRHRALKTKASGSPLGGSWPELGDEREQWLDAVRPLEERFVKKNEALGLPVAAFV